MPFMLTSGGKVICWTRAVLLLGIAMVMPALFANEPVTLEKELVTGSHISRLDISGALPLVVIDRQQIERSGLTTVAEVLRQSPWNSFGSFREVSGNTGQSQAEVSLRGLGAERTLVLLDGHRLPNSPVVDGEAVDLNILPLSAVDRIEILQDGASAIYGSEAIGGVINIVLRKSFQGTDISGLLERPSQPGGDADGVSLVHGGDYDRGSYLFSLEHHSKKIIWSRDRWWSRKSLGDGVNFDTTRGLSMMGNTVWRSSTGLYEPYQGSCDPKVFAGVFQYPSADPAVNQGTVCAYAYADVAGETNDLQRDSGFLYLDFDIDESNQLYFKGLFSRMDSFGRFAPALGGPDDGGFYVFDPRYGENVWLGLRFYTFGPRDDEMVNRQADALLGLKGEWNKFFNYDIFVRYDRYAANYTGRNYLLADVTRAAIQSGQYDPLNPLATPSAVMERMRTTIGRDMHENYFNTGVNLSGDAPFSLPGGSVAWALGYEYRREDFADIYDDQSQAGNIIGTAGGSAWGDRRQWAFYGELVMPVLDSLEATMALRHDSYSDVGAKTSPQLRLKWDALDNLVLRASWGKGFRAPSMSDLHSAPSWGVEVVRDCLPVTSCAAAEWWVQASGNPNLKPESSDSWDFGFEWSPGDLDLAADLYSIDIHDAIQIYSAQALINLDNQGLPLPPGTSVDHVNGVVNSALANVSRQQVRGVDLTASYSFSLGRWGSLEPSASWIHVLKFFYQAAPEVDGQDVAGSWSTVFGPAPDDRAQLSLHWDYHDLGVTWLVDYIDHMRAEPHGIASWTSHTLSLSWDTPWKGRLVAGVRNLFDRDPPIDLSVEADYTAFYYLYPIEGRVLFLNYTQHFD